MVVVVAGADLGRNRKAKIQTGGRRVEKYVSVSTNQQRDAKAFEC